MGDRGSRGGRGLLAYALIPVLSAVSPLIALPAITDRYGAAAWAGVAVGQSMGAAAATVVELGWGLNGPQRVARMSATAANGALALATRTKLLVLVPAAALAALVAFVVAPSFPIEAAVVAIGATAAALSAAWWFLGRARPLTLVLTDAVPRMIAMGLAGVLVFVGAPLMTYAAVGLIAPSVLAPSLALVIARRESSAAAPRYGLVRLAKTIRFQSHALTARVASAGYIALPITLVSIAAPGSVAVFAAGERLMRMGLAAMSIIPNAMQGWVGRPAAKRERWVRAKRAVAMNVVIGVVAGLVFGLLAPAASHLVFSGTATVSPALALTFALVILVVTVSRATGGLALVALRRIGAYATSAVAGAVVGIPTILLLSAWVGAPGGALGELAAELTVLITQVVVIARHRQGDK